MIVRRKKQKVWWEIWSRNSWSMHIAQYKRILPTGDRMISNMKMFRLNMWLSAYDDKRFIQDDGISSYSYAH